MAMENSAEDISEDGPDYVQIVSRVGRKLQKRAILAEKSIALEQCFLNERNLQTQLSILPRMGKAELSSTEDCGISVGQAMPYLLHPSLRSAVIRSFRDIENSKGRW